MVSFFNAVEEYETDIYTNKKAKTDPQLAKVILPEVLSTLSEINQWNNDNLFAALANKAQELGYKNITMMYPMQVALSGRSVAPGGATAIAEILGKQETLNRIKNATDRLD